MPRLLIEPRPYSLIRAQNSRAPLLLLRAAHFFSLSLSLSLCKLLRFSSLSLCKLLRENKDEDASIVQKREPPLACCNKLSRNGRNQHITLVGGTNKIAKCELCVSHRCRKRDHHCYCCDAFAKEEERSRTPPITSGKQQHHRSPPLQRTHRKTPPLRCWQPRSCRSCSSTQMETLPWRRKNNTSSCYRHHDRSAKKTRPEPSIAVTNCRSRHKKKTTLWPRVPLQLRQKMTLWPRVITEATKFPLLASPQYVSVLKSRQNYENNRT